MHLKNVPTLSIVVAAVNAAATLDGWLAAIRPQVQTGNVEVLLVCTPDVHPRADDRFIRTVTVGVGTLVPMMWSAGIERARGSIIAVTITPCVPASDWVESIVTAHREPYAAIGGVIDQAPDADLVDRALHLVRYTPYLPPQPPGPVAEVAGDNGTYARAALEPFMTAIAADGFWEADINRRLRARGETLWLDPRIRVTHAGSYSASAFSRQRFVHGRVFGRSRRATFSFAGRAAHAALAPLVPVLMLGRHLRTVSARGRIDVRTLMAVPLALWFLTCWAAGEAAGLLGG